MRRTSFCNLRFNTPRTPFNFGLETIFQASRGFFWHLYYYLSIKQCLRYLSTCLRILINWHFYGAHVESKPFFCIIVRIFLFEGHVDRGYMFRGRTLMRFLHNKKLL
jgi:hypothetical protein